MVFPCLPVSMAAARHQPMVGYTSDHPKHKNHKNIHSPNATASKRAWKMSRHMSDLIMDMTSDFLEVINGATMNLH